VGAAARTERAIETVVYRICGRRQPRGEGSGRISGRPRAPVDSQRRRSALEAECPRNASLDCAKV